MDVMAESESEKHGRKLIEDFPFLEEPLARLNAMQEEQRVLKAHHTEHGPMNRCQCCGEAKQTLFKTKKYMAICISCHSNLYAPYLD
jgi:hypothetical protein